mmetsp:Transcript_856/g.2500  ORF Transcript_856/g.2500 Transcript_856/m.2500 type:complete len:288 (+) Transcript_856:1618-2481(+)
MRKASMTAPSSSSEVESAGMEPGALPPTSAWWPREAQKKAGRDESSSSKKSGEMTVMSGRWEPPALGSLATTTSPGPRATLASWALTVSDMAPRWTGTWGAFATRPPSAAKRAHEKSRRSLMFTELAVRWRVRPICSAIDMKRWPKTPSKAGSTTASSSTTTRSSCSALGGTEMRTSPWRVTVAAQPGSRTQVEVPMATTAGPSRRSPAPSRSSSKTGASSTQPVASKKIRQVSTGAGGVDEGGSRARVGVALVATARTRQSSTRTRFEAASSKPYSRLNAAAIAAA